MHIKKFGVVIQWLLKCFVQKMSVIVCRSKHQHEMLYMKTSCILLPTLELTLCYIKGRAHLSP